MQEIALLNDAACIPGSGRINHTEPHGRQMQDIPSESTAH